MSDDAATPTVSDIKFCGSASIATVTGQHLFDASLNTWAWDGAPLLFDACLECGNQSWGVLCSGALFNLVVVQFSSRLRLVTPLSFLNPPLIRARHITYPRVTASAPAWPSQGG